MRFSRAFTAAAVAISMVGTPVLAQSASSLSVAPSAAPLSLTNSASRGGATLEDTNGLNRQFTIGIGVVLLLVLAAILIPEITKSKSP